MPEQYYYINGNFIVFKFSLYNSIILRKNVNIVYYLENLKKRDVPDSILNELEDILSQN